MPRKPRIRKLTFTVFVDSADVMRAKDEFQEFFYNADTPMFKKSAPKMEIPGPDEVTRKAQAWFDSMI